MIRVKPDRCGYTGYSCSGVGNLTAAFSGKSLVCDSLAASRVDNWLVPNSENNYIDNYNNLPVLVKGFIMTTDHLLDMENGIGLSCTGASGNCVEPPEIACGSFGWNAQYQTLVGLWIRLYMDIADYAAIVAESASLPQWTVLPTEEAGSALCFTEPTELQMLPGILEPMLDTSFKPVGVSVQLSSDIALDGAMISLVQLTRWRIAVDAKLNSIMDLLSSIGGGGDSAMSHIMSMRNMISNLNRGWTQCANFKIYLYSGNPLQWSSSVTPPQYKIEGGMAYINGVGVTIPAYTSSISAGSTGFYAYIKFTLTADNSGNALTPDYSAITPSWYISTSSAPLASSTEIYIGIGGVHVAAGEANDHPKYTLWEIVQERCDIDIDILRVSSSGIIYRTNGTATPYSGLDTAECPT